MDKYEQVQVVGEGSYGLVMKCRHKETDQIVAVKKFLETEEDANIRRMALREIRMLKRLRHENLVTMIEVFRHRKRFYIVFEYVAGTVLDELEKCHGGLDHETSRDWIFQVTRAVSYCHNNYIIHRDVKPENVLVSSLGVVKLCDFGFARIISPTGEPYTEYVATRWYRAPELLVGDVNYTGAVDIWAIGCLFVEMMTGDPIFPGESDIDQLYLIVKMLGKPCAKHQHLMSRNSQLRTMIKSANQTPDLHKSYPDWPTLALHFLSTCLRMDPNERLGSDDLLKSEYFTHDRLPQRLLPALRDKVNTEFNENPLLRKFKTEILMSTDKKDELVRQPPQRKFHMHDANNRWKINMPESGTKRKFQQNDQQHQHLLSDGSSGVISLNNSSIRLSLLQNFNNSKQGVSQKQSHGTQLVNKVCDSTFLTVTDKSSMKMAKSITEASPRSLSALKNKMVSPDRTTPVTPKSLQVEHEQLSSKTTTNTTEFFLKTPLRPSINNINLNVVPKKSPLQRNAGPANKAHHQVPPLGPPRNIMKKLDRNVNVDTTTFSNSGNIDSIPVSMGPNSWMANFTHPLPAKKRDAKKVDNFTLPNVPGATGSPNKLNKKKGGIQSNQDDPLFNSSNQVTPDYRYRKTKRKLNILDISIPVTIKENEH